ncbi:MAG: hypothetical protein E7595_04450 [Ruminococcaceae bacterium]|nr:hypothetical protein [Oscillospiraceae bacterium]
MKKSFFIFLVLSLLLSACTMQADIEQSQNTSATAEGESTLSEICDVSETSSEKSTNIYVTFDGIGHYLDNMFEYPIKSLLFSGGWSEEIPDCVCDFTVRFPDTVFEYHSECGTIIWEGKSKQLSDYDTANLNDLLFSLFEQPEDSDTSNGLREDSVSNAN